MPILKTPMTLKFQVPNPQVLNSFLFLTVLSLSSSISLRLWLFHWRFDGNFGGKYLSLTNIVISPKKLGFILTKIGLRKEEKWSST